MKKMVFLLIEIPDILLGVKGTVIDICCDVVDNYGDIAIAYRLAKDLVKRKAAVRLLVNDLSTFRSLVPEVDCSLHRQNRGGIDIIDTRHPESPRVYARMEHEILIEAFGCSVPEDFLEGFIPQPAEPRLIINLEYLSAEGWTASYHEKESLTGIEGVRKFFFMPGFSRDSGGLILDDDFLALKAQTDENRLQARIELCLRYGIDESLAVRGSFVTLFSYRRNLKPLLRDLEALGSAVVFAASGASTQPVTGSVPKGLTLAALPFLPQAEYDRLLLASDINLVRGEDSLMRAVIAGKPFLWHAYLQEGGAHMEKVDAFCRLFSPFFSDPQLGERVSRLFLSYNDRNENASEIPLSEDFSPFLSRLGEIEEASRRLSASVMRNGSLADRLLAFIRRIGAGQ